MGFYEYNKQKLDLSFLSTFKPTIIYFYFTHINNTEVCQNLSDYKW